MIRKRAWRRWKKSVGRVEERAWKQVIQTGRAMEERRMSRSYRRRWRWKKSIREITSKGKTVKKMNAGWPIIGHSQLWMR